MINKSHKTARETTPSYILKKANAITENLTTATCSFLTTIFITS